MHRAPQSQLFLKIAGHSYSRHRSHFGSRYKLGCCGHAGLFDPGSIPPGSLLLGPLGSLLFPNSRKSPFVEFGLFFVTWIFLFFLLDLFCSALLPPSLPPLTLSLEGSCLGAFSFCSHFVINSDIFNYCSNSITARASLQQQHYCSNSITVLVY